MGGFSDVDRSDRADELVGYLEHAHHGLAGPKALLRAGLRVRAGGRVLDLGCGSGHELVQLERDGVAAFGLDASTVMLDVSRERLAGLELTGRLVQADAAHLPFADGSFDAARVERVLQHVADPARVIGELSRVIRPGGTLAVMEPDWASFTIASELPQATDAIVREIGATIAQRDVGRHLRRLLIAAGFVDVRYEVDLAVYTSVDDLSTIISVERAAGRAVARGAITREQADGWLSEQKRFSADGGFVATLNRAAMAWGEVPPA